MRVLAEFVVHFCSPGDRDREHFCAHLHGSATLCERSCRPYHIHNHQIALLNVNLGMQHFGIRTLTWGSTSWSDDI
jgi:hypothetical protein